MSDNELFERYGWTVECESPFEMRHKDGSFATGQAAYLVKADILAQESTNVYPKIKVHYMTEFGGMYTTLDLEGVLPFSKKFHIISLKWEEDF